MDFTITGLRRCTGGNHIEVDLSVGAQSATLRFRRDELDLEPAAIAAIAAGEDTREAILARLRSAAKEAGAATPAQIQAALVGKSFKV